MPVKAITSLTAEAPQPDRPMTMSTTTKIDTGGPAFPTENERQIGPSSFHYEGRTLLDHFAGLAITALVVDDRYSGPPSHADLATEAYQIAQAMIAEKRRLEAE